MGAASATFAAVVGLAVILGGSATPVLRPLQVLTGSAGNSSNNNDDGGGATTSTVALDAAGNPRRTTTTIAGQTTTTRKSGSHSSTTVAPPAATSTNNGATATTAYTVTHCKQSDLQYRTDTNKKAYSAGEDVQISVSVRNTSSRPCYGPDPCGIGPWAEVQNSSGTTIWRNSPTEVTCVKPAPPAPRLGPGEAYEFGTVATWNQVECPNGDGCTEPRAPIGTYRAIGHRGTVTANGITFGLRD